jgi:general secretion pathway protein L
MGSRAGLYVADGQLTVAVLSGRGGAAECFAIETSETPGARLKTELDSRRVRLRRLHIGLTRSVVTVKTLELPRGVGGSLQDMVAFELERHVPFTPEELRFDVVTLPGPAKGSLPVLVAACERRTVDAALRLLEDARLKPAAITVACHDLPGFLARNIRTRYVVWAHRTTQGTDILCLAQGRLVQSRTVPAETAEALAAEVQATLLMLGWRECETLWISGDGAAELMDAPELADLGLLVAEPPWSARARRRLASLPEEGRGAAMLAVAAASGPKRPLLNLLPEELRPRTVTAGQVVTTCMVVVTALLGLAILAAQGYQQQRYAAGLAGAVQSLDAEVKRVERLSADVATKKKLLETVQAIEKGDARPLPVLRELTERLPQDAWLRTFSMDRQGIEITGQAAAANQLIPILEGSPLFTKVEFTGPVTKAGDKEQFRIKAAWKTATVRPEETDPKPSAPASGRNPARPPRPTPPVRQ